MDKLREIALAFCAVSVFSAAAGLLRGKSLLKSGKYIIGLVFICALISCFKDASFRVEMPESSFSQYSESTALSCQGAEYLVAEVLKENFKNFSKISVTATKNDDGDIIINEITVYGADDREGVMTVLSSVGIDCRVTFG